jgi:hypothetical protein
MKFFVVGKNGVSYESERERDLFEEASLRLGMSVIEIIRFVEALLMVEMDPIRPTGERFEFKHKVQGLPDDDLFSWINAEIPSPDAKVDLWKAWEEMRLHDRNCEWIMQNNPTNAAVLRVMANQLAWLRFGAVRWPTENGRKAFHGLSVYQEAAIQSLIEMDRRRRGGEAVVEALEEMLAS